MRSNSLHAARARCALPALALLLCAGAARAWPSVDPLDPLRASATPAAEPSPTAPPATVTRKPFATPVASGKLGGSRGGAASSDTTGEVRNTTATNVSGGANTVRDGSFANAAGLTTVIQNSGSNVLIQNSTTVNVQFRP